MEAKEALPIDSLATLNQDGGVTKLVVAPLVVIFGVLVLIAAVRIFQRIRERHHMEESLKE